MSGAAQPPATFSVVEIFDSLEGEGKRAGATATFIRLAGCNLRCGYCDTAHALEAESGAHVTLEEILARVNPVYKRVTLTGGEPLLAPGAADLVKALLAQGCEVNIETNGSVDVADFRSRVGDSKSLFFSVDYKLPSSGESGKMLDANYFSLRGRDVLKFVVGGEGDLAAMFHLVERIQGHLINAIFAKKDAPPEMPQIFIGAVYGAYDLPALADVIVKTPILKDARLQLQLHKIIWGPDKQGV
ncbi:MAG: radical SAM protein [Defluviitaleaceae bacterium]|nr:radical SAM protein [Defluviitaleaceae bacterium]MCL2240093.1 radical SAM protein [Defluviitaleaceae bacterium]